MLYWALATRWIKHQDSSTVHKNVTENEYKLMNVKSCGDNFRNCHWLLLMAKALSKD